MMKIIISSALFSIDAFGQKILQLQVGIHPITFIQFENDGADAIYLAIRYNLERNSISSR